MKLILEAIKSLFREIKIWVKHEAFTADDALDIIIEMDLVKPVCSADGTIYTTKDGTIYTL